MKKDLNLSLCIEEKHLSLINALRRDRAAVDLLADSAIKVLINAGHDYGVIAAIEQLRGILHINSQELL